MARFLLAWELGGGLGHLFPLGAAAKQLHERGHHVTLAVRHPEHAHWLALPDGIDVISAPYKGSRCVDRIDPIYTFAHVLHNTGMSDADELGSLVRAWRSVMKLVRPDLVVCDHSPTALLAAKVDGIARATIGTGFCHPPRRTPWPVFRHGIERTTDELLDEEAALLGKVNRVLKCAGVEELASLSELYGRDVAAILTTFEELDHYPRRPAATFFGALTSGGGGVAPTWPQGRGPRLFAYLKDRPGVEHVLAMLRSTGCPTLAYVSGCSSKLLETYRGTTVHISDKFIDMQAAAESCDIGLCHAGHGAICDFLTAGKPMLLLPITLEQGMNGEHAERCGFGVSLAQNRLEQLPAALEHILKHPSYNENCRRFQRRYADYSPESQLDRAVGYMESLAEAGPTANVVESVRYSHHDIENGRTQLIVGMGTGRCGTKSLAAVLCNQPGTAVLHEGKPRLPWEPGDEDLVRRFERIGNYWPGVRRFGDVGPYYLTRVPELVRLFPNIRIVCMRRERAATVTSYMRWLEKTRPGQLLDHWRAERTGLDEDSWDICYPKYEVDTLEEGLGRFWDDYYATAEAYAEQFPGNVRIFDMEPTLNDEQAISALLTWVGVPPEEQVLEVEHYNQSAARS